MTTAVQKEDSSYNVLRMLYSLDVETEQTAHQTNQSSYLQTQFINLMLLLCFCNYLCAKADIATVVQLIVQH